jgi:hypothetical protein
MTDEPNIWLSRRAIGLHAVIIVIVPSFAALCIWQLHRALDGNNLSWAYVFEWPFFAGYAVYMWWRFVHEMPQPETEPTPVAVGAASVQRVDPEEDEAAAAYNQYLSDLNQRDQPKRWR